MWETLRRVLKKIHFNKRKLVAEWIERFERDIEEGEAALSLLSKEGGTAEELALLTEMLESDRQYLKGLQS